MTRLRTFRLILKWVAIYQLDPDELKWKKIISLVFFVASVILQIWSIQSSLLFFVTFLSIDLEISVDCLYGLVGALNTMNLLLSMFFLRHKVNDIFDKLTAIFAQSTIKAKKCTLNRIKKKHFPPLNSGTAEMSYRFLERANIQSDLIWRNYFKFIVCGILMYSILTPLLSVIACYIFHGHFDADHFLYLYKIV